MIQVMHRRLVLLYVFFGRPFAWRCSLCRRMFVNGLEGSHVHEVEREFAAHDCWPALKAKLQDMW